MKIHCHIIIFFSRSLYEESWGGEVVVGKKVRRGMIRVSACVLTASAANGLSTHDGRAFYLFV